MDRHPVPIVPIQMQYWYGSLEKKARAWDIDYVRKNFAGTRFVEIPGLDHAEYALLHPAELAERMLTFWNVEAELKQAWYARDYKVIIYPKVSHLTGMMPNRQRERRLYRMILLVSLMYRSFGKYKKENLAALERSEKEIVDWLNA